MFLMFTSEAKELVLVWNLGRLKRCPEAKYFPESFEFGKAKSWEETAS
jgi:hypothetical protein